MNVTSTIERMRIFGSSTNDELRHTTSALLARVQRLEEEQAALRTRLEGERQLRIYIAQVGRGAVAPFSALPWSGSLRRCGHLSPLCRADALAASRAQKPRGAISTGLHARIRKGVGVSRRIRTLRRGRAHTSCSRLATRRRHFCEGRRLNDLCFSRTLPLP